MKPRVSSDLCLCKELLDISKGASWFFDIYLPRIDWRLLRNIPTHLLNIYRVAQRLRQVLILKRIFLKVNITSTPSRPVSPQHVESGQTREGSTKFTTQNPTALKQHQPSYYRTLLEILYICLHEGITGYGSIPEGSLRMYRTVYPMI